MDKTSADVKTQIAIERTVMIRMWKRKTSDSSMHWRMDLFFAGAGFEEVFFATVLCFSAGFLDDFVAICFLCPFLDLLFIF